MPGPATLNVLQKVQYTDATRAGTVASGGLGRNDGVFTGVADDRVTFDGIFGAFFDGYWTRYTDIGNLMLCLRLTGHVEILVERVFSSTGRREEVVRTRLRGAGEETSVPVPMAVDGATRLVLTLIILDSASEVSALAWATPTPPKRRVGLVAVICTFNRDGDVAATLCELSKVASDFERILVINQGDPHLVDRLARHGFVGADELVTVIDQDNLGGAGGFGRGILECLSDDRCTDILLMDDDIDLDRDIIPRLTTMLSYLRTDHAVGGAMLDRHDRTTLFSIGDVLHESRPEIRNLIDPTAADITSQAASRYLALHHQPDFNGWWFFAFPKTAIGRIGMPLPMFIRGDDVEYGYRLALSGVRTLAWPGLAVWHEPFHTKRHPWHYFYDRRNSLYLCEMNGRFGRLHLLKSMTIGFFNHLLRFDYDRATCITLGLKAFNDGAAALQRWSGEDHALLSAQFASREFPAVADVRSSTMSTSRVPRFLLFVGRLLVDMVYASPKVGKPIVVRSHDWRPVVRHRPRRIRVHYIESRMMADFTHDRGRARTCSTQFLKEVARFMMRPWRPQLLKSLTQPDFWSSYTAQNLPNSRRA